MTLSPPTRCSTLAEELDEPMIGTVDQRSRWLLLEDHGAWGTDAVKDVLGADFAREAKSLGVRPLLVRRREGDPATDVHRRAILVDTETREMATRTVEDPSQLSASELARTPVAAFGAPVHDPIFLVCTNGKRDACCAIRGRLLAAAMASRHADQTWETTHLGGHRFAANLVCLPDGIVYGRVSPGDGPRLADAYLGGTLDASRLRGRSSWPAAAQVAEQDLRLRHGLTGLDDVRLERVAADRGRASVTLFAGDAVHPYELVAEAIAPRRPVGCRADELEAPLHWRVVAR